MGNVMGDEMSGKSEKGGAFTGGESVTVTGDRVRNVFFSFVGSCQTVCWVLLEGGNAGEEHYLTYSLTPGIGCTC